MKPHMWKHWVVRASTPYKPFNDFETAQWTWRRLTDLYPDKICAVLMPNHLHLILPSQSKLLGELRETRGDGGLRKLTGLLGGLTKRIGQRNLWQTIPAPSEIPDVFHLRRQVRYVALNPCRKGLCSDPLEWYWSTYREVMGAAIGRQTQIRDLARVIGSPEFETVSKFQVRFHAYVSGDPSVCVTGSPPPISAFPKLLPNESLGEILAASAGALRVSLSEVRNKRSRLRPLFIHMCARHGWHRPLLLSKICEMSVSGVHLVLGKEPPNEIRAADLCLGDVRLRPKDWQVEWKFWA